MTREQALALRAQIEQMFAYVPDAEAATAAWMAHPWKPDIAYAVGDRVQDDGILYKCRQAHTSQSAYRPASVPALWEVVADPAQSGTRDNPITYNSSMAIENGKFYVDADVLYECIRDSVNPLYCALSAVVGNYVQIAS